MNFQYVNFKKSQATWNCIEIPASLFNRWPIWNQHGEPARFSGRPTPLPGSSKNSGTPSEKSETGGHV